MIYNWIKIAFRNFAKNKMATFINVFGLTLGLLGLIITLLYTNDQLSYDQWIQDKDRIISVGYQFDDEKDIWGVSYPQMEKAKANMSGIEDILLVSAMGYESTNVINGDKIVQATKIVESTPNFFAFFPYKFIEGNPATALNAKNHLVVSEDFAKKAFGEENPMGKNLQIGKTNYIVQGVFRIEEKSSIMPEIIYSFEKMDAYWGNYSYNAYIKMKTPISISDFKDQYYQAVWAEQIEREAQEEGMTVEEVLENFPFQIAAALLVDSRFEMFNSATFFEPYGNKSIIRIMFAISILLLVISMVNFINLSMAAAVKRAKEVGVRKAIGAGKSLIVYQNLFETTLLTLFSFVLAMVGIELILPYFNDFMQTEIQLHFRLFLGIILLIVVLISLLTGIIPAVYLSNFKIIEVLKGSFSRSSKGIYLRNAMLGVQFMIASFFFMGSLIVYFQINYLNQLDLGFNKEQLMALNFRYKTDKPFQEYEKVKTRLMNIDGVAAVNSVRPLVGTQTGYSTTEFNFKGKKVSNVQYNSVDFGYPEMTQMTLLKGRFLSDQFASDTISSVVINETLAKELGIYDDPINQKLGENTIVVGMVKNYHIADAFSPIPAAFMHHWKAFDGSMVYNLRNVVIKFDAEKLPHILSELETYWPNEVITNAPFEYSFIDKNFEKTYEQYVRQQNIFGVMTALVILVALLGLYALSSFIIEQRLKEVAIRKTLGAETKNIILRFAKPYLFIGSVSILLTFPWVIYLANEWLQDFAYRIDLSIMPFLLCFLILLSLTLLVVSLKAWRATKINLVNYLKYE